MCLAALSILDNSDHLEFMLQRSRDSVVQRGLDLVLCFINTCGVRVVSHWSISKAAVASRFCHPLERAIVKALACDLPRQHRQPLARYSMSDLVRCVEAEPQVRPMSRSTIWRILAEDAIKPWQHRCWIFPRDPDFVEKARVVLNLYAGFWQGRPLADDDYVISADEKTSIQARVRLHPTLAPAPGQAMRYEHEYERGGALQYLAAWDVRYGVPLGRCEAKTGIEPFHRLVDLVMTKEPYRSGRRVFWIVDGGSSHRGGRFAQRLESWYQNAIAVPLPVHASWLNQIEIYFSALRPTSFVVFEGHRSRHTGCASGCGFGSDAGSRLFP